MDKYLFKDTLRCESRKHYSKADQRSNNSHDPWSLVPLLIDMGAQTGLLKVGSVRVSPKGKTENG